MVTVSVVTTSKLMIMLILCAAECYKVSLASLDQVNDQTEQVVVQIELNQAYFLVSEQFLSVTIDAGAIRNHWSGINLTSPPIINMAKALSPAMLRIGGTAQDYLLFSLLNKDQSDLYQNKENYMTQNDTLISNYIMTSRDWDLVNDFARDVGWDVIFGLNVFLRRNGSEKLWDATNAKDLIKYTDIKGYKVSWELGNEPDLFPTPYSSIAPNILAANFEDLKDILDEMNLDPPYIAGPDVASLFSDGDYYSNFLKSVKRGIINAVTWHQYYMNGHTAIEKDFYNIDYLDGFADSAVSALQLVDEYQPMAEMWLGETSSAYDSGTKGLSDVYLAGFMWLDKLGLAALANHSRVFRQAFKGGYYGLLDDHANPLPDYWLSVLYKKLVGVEVLKVMHGTDKGREVRIYAHCANTKTGHYSPGDIVLIILNMKDLPSFVYFSNEELTSAARDVYWLEPFGPDGQKSNKVSLNGNLLSLVDELTLPDLPPKEGLPGESALLPAKSFGFYVFKNVKAKACII